MRGVVQRWVSSGCIGLWYSDNCATGCWLHSTVQNGADRNKHEGRAAGVLSIQTLWPPAVCCVTLPSLCRRPLVAPRTTWGPSLVYVCLEPLLELNTEALCFPVVPLTDMYRLGKRIPAKKGKTFKGVLQPAFIPLVCTNLVQKSQVCSLSNGSRCCATSYHVGNLPVSMNTCNDRHYELALKHE